MLFLAHCFPKDVMIVCLIALVVYVIRKTFIRLQV
jgi:hypothetical protein